jgi:hypothetical protein
MMPRACVQIVTVWAMCGGVSDDDGNREERTAADTTNQHPGTNTTFALNIHTHRGSLCLMMAAMRDDDTSALTAELKLVSVKR